MVLQGKTLYVGALVVFLVGLLLVSPVVAWLLKTLGYLLMALAVLMVILGLVRGLGRGRTRSY